MSDPAGMPPNPYVGPRAFTRHDTLFGRDVEKLNLLNILISERIVLLYSPSGAGKTSLIQAGVVPALEEERFRPLPVIRVNRAPEGSYPSPSENPTPLSPSHPHPNPSPIAIGEGHPPSPCAQGEGGRGVRAASGRGVEPENRAPPNRYISSALHSLAAGLPGHDASDLNGLSLSAFLDRLDGGEEPPAGESADPVVLIFDQFEEILTVEPADLAVKDAFFAQVGEALRPRHRWALFSMREEYIAALDPYLRHLPTRLATTFRLGLLEPAAAQEAIQKPAAQVGVDFTDPAAIGLIHELIEVQEQLPDGTPKAESLPFVEPVQLQVVCTRFWERLPWAELPVHDDRRQITPDHVAALAQVNDALADYYDAKLATVAADGSVPQVLERQIREWIDANLITERGTRAQLRIGAERDQTLPDPVIQALVDAYLIRREGRPGDRWYELAHDRLVQPIRESNETWLRSHLEPVQLRARQWDETGRRRESLLRGGDLNRARSWADANLRLLPAWEHTLLSDFIGDSVREQRTRLGRIAQVAGLAFLALVLVVVWTVSEQRRAEERNREIAEALISEQNLTLSNLLASQSAASLRDGQFDLALLLAAEGVQTGNTPEARGALLQALTAQPGVETYLGRQASAPTVIAVSPDGTMAASAACARQEISCVDSEIRLWDLATRQPLGDLRHPDGSVEVLSLAFSPNNQTIAGGGADSGVVLWDVATREPIAELLEETTRGVPSVAFSRDGETLAVGNQRGAIVLWDLITRQPHDRMLSGHQGQVTSLAYSPDGTLASGGRDGVVLIWDGARPRLRCRPADGDCVVVAPDDMPAGGSSEGSGAGGGLPVVPLPSYGPIQNLIFSPDGRWLAAGTSGGPIVVWETASGRERSEVLTRPYAVLGVAFNADGSILDAVQQSGGLFRWNLVGGGAEVDFQAPSGLSAAAFSPDGTTLVAGDASGDVLLLDLEKALPLAERFTLGSAVSGIAITPDGQTFAAGTEAGLVPVWDIASGDRIWTSPDAVGPITAVVLGPDASMVAAGSRDGQVYRWEVDRDDRDDAPIVFAAGRGAVTGLALSEDGRTLAAGSADGMVRVWDVTQPTGAPVALAADGGAVGTVAFSPDGNLLVTGRADGSVEVRTADNLAASPRVLDSNQRPVLSLAFNPRDETTLAASGRGVSILDTTSGERVGSLPSRSNETIDAIAFSPDGATLVMGSADGAISLWDLATNLEIGTLTGHAGAVRGLGFADDGTLVSGSADGAVLVWSVGAEAMRARACRITNRNLTPEEWEEFIPDRARRATCPEFPLDGTTPSAADGGTPGATP